MNSEKFRAFTKRFRRSSASSAKGEMGTTRSRDTSEQLIFKTKADHRFPTWGQFAYFFRVMNPTERVIAAVCAVLIVVGLPLFVGRLYAQNSVVMARDGGSYTEGLIGIPQYVNPLLAPLSDVDSDVSRLVYSGFFRYDENQELQPDIITNYTISEDKKTYTFFLRRDVKWHDDQPMTAEDVMFTIQTIQDPLYQSPLQGVLKGVQATKIDDYSFSLELKEPFAPFLTTLTFGILPKHVWFSVPPQNFRLSELNLQPIGTGPYLMNELTKDREGSIKSLELTKNKAYYGAKPHIETLSLVFYPDEATAVEALKDKKIEGLAFFSAMEREGIERKNRSVRLYGLRIPQYTAVFFNQKKSVPLQEGAVRKALALAVNREDIIQEVFSGQAEPIHSSILPGYLGYNPEAEKYLLNPEEANKLLDDADWTYPEGKDANSEPFEPRQKDGKNLEFTVATVDLPEYQQTLQILQSAWQRIGVKVNVDVYGSQDIQSTVIKDRNYEALLFGQIVGTDPDPYPFWHSSQQEYPGLGLAIFRDREADQLLEEARKATNDEERHLKYLHFQNNMAQDAPAIFLYNPTYQYAVHKKIRGVAEKQYITVPSDRFSAVESWFIRADRQWNPDQAKGQQ